MTSEAYLSGQLGQLDQRISVMNGKKIGVGIIGTGAWARYGHIAALQTLDEFEVVAIGSRSQETAEKVTRRGDAAEGVIVVEGVRGPGPQCPY